MTAPPRSPLGPRAHAILHAIRAHIRDHGRPPSTTELAAAVGLSSAGSVGHHLGVLVRRGYIDVDPGVPRGIRVLKPGPVLHVIEGEAKR